MKRDMLRRIVVMSICMIIAFGMIILFFVTPNSGLDATSAKLDILDNHFEYTGADNAVSAIYLNLRLWDTLFEALVLLVSAVAVISFSRSDDNE